MKSSALKKLVHNAILVFCTKFAPDFPPGVATALHQKGNRLRLQLYPILDKFCGNNISKKNFFQKLYRPNTMAS